MSSSGSTLPFPQPPGADLAPTATSWTEPLASPVRFVAAALLAVVAAAHLLVVEDQFDRAVYLGALYVLVAVSSLGLAALLCSRDSRVAWLLAGLAVEIGLAVFVLSRSVGLPLVADDIGRWTEPLAALAAVLEVSVVALAGYALTRRDVPGQTRSASRVPLVGGVVALQVGAVLVIAAASITGPAVPATASLTTSGYWSSVGGAAAAGKGTVRTYYIAADEVAWNYAPLGRNGITGQPFDDTATTYVQSGRGRIGATYLKCLYHGYTDASFRTPAKRTADDAYLGTLGPVIRAAVGDTIKVVYRNNCRFATSVHPHGVFYAKDSEGAPYDDGTSGKGKDTADDAVPKGGTHTYTWEVPERAGPGPHDGSSVMWMYHSHTDEVGDTYAGLMGPMVVTSRAMARADATPQDVDREFFVMYSVMNENNSPYLQANLAAYAKEPFPIDLENEEFAESNLMHSINGYVFGNQPMMTMKKGQHVRWYVMGMGTEVDLHTPHWHGNDVVVGGMRMDVVDLLPATMVIADMVPDNAGTWLFHCHVNDHLTAGMITRYRVTP